MTGEMVIILNKTAPLNQNGDSMILASLMADSSTTKIDSWIYPTKTNYSMASANSVAN